MIEIESCTVRLLNKDLFQDRLELCGNEDLNGMELWGSLYSKYSGEGKLAILTGGSRSSSRLGSARTVKLC